MKLVLALILSFALTGCGLLQRLPDEVKIPVPVPCKVETPNKPTLRYSPPYDSIFEAVRDLLGDREAQNAYEIELEAALKACKK